MGIELQPPPVKQPLLGPKGLADEYWLNFYIALSQTLNQEVTPSDAPLITFEANTALTNAQNLGAFATGYLFSTVTLGIATLSSSPTIPMSRITWNPLSKAFADTGFVASAGDFIAVNATGGATTIKLPASPTFGSWVAVKKTDASGNAITINGNGHTIDGAATQALAVQWNAKTSVWNGTEWFLQASL